MRTRLTLDIGGLSLEEHRALADNLQHFCQQFEIVEADRRTDRPIDAETLGAIGGIVSAICGVIGLLTQYRYSHRRSGKVGRTMVASSIVQVEKTTGLQLSEDIKETICTAFESDDSPIQMSFTLEEKRYSMSVYYEEHCSHIKGRLSRP